MPTIQEIKEFKRGLLTADFNVDKDPATWTEAIVGTGTSVHGLSKVVMTTNAIGDKVTRATTDLPHGVGTITKGIFSFRSKPEAGKVVRIGFFDDNDGLFVEMDDTGYYFVVRKFAIDDKVSYLNMSPGLVPSAQFPFPFADFTTGDALEGTAIIEYGYGVETSLGWVDVSTKLLVQQHNVLLVGDTAPSRTDLPLRYEIEQTGAGSFELEQLYVGVFTTDSDPAGFPQTVVVDVTSGPIEITIPVGEPLEVEFPDDFEVTIDTSTPLDVNVTGQVEVTIPTGSPLEVEFPDGFEVTIDDSDPVNVNIFGAVEIDDTNPIDVNVITTVPPDEGSCTVVGSGQVIGSGLLSSLITIPATAKEAIIITSSAGMRYTLDGVSTPAFGIGRTVHIGSNVHIRGNALMNDMIVDTMAHTVWLEFFNEIGCTEADCGCHDEEEDTIIPCDGPCDGKVNSLTLQYTGPGGAVLVYDDHHHEDYFDGTLATNDIFTITGSETDNKFHQNTIGFYVDTVFNADVHVSCSQPIGPGLVLGDFTIIEGTSVDGGKLCPL